MEQETGIGPSVGVPERTRSVDGGGLGHCVSCSNLAGQHPCEKSKRSALGIGGWTLFGVGAKPTTSRTSSLFGKFDDDTNARQVLGEGLPTATLPGALRLRWALGQNVGLFQCGRVVDLFGEVRDRTLVWSITVKAGAVCSSPRGIHPRVTLKPDLRCAAAKLDDEAEALPRGGESWRIRIAATLSESSQSRLFRSLRRPHAETKIRWRQPSRQHLSLKLWNRFTWKRRS
jgi:hypothetical protein